MQKYSKKNTIIHQNNKVYPKADINNTPIRMRIGNNNLNNKQNNTKVNNNAISPNGVKTISRTKKTSIPASCRTNVQNCTNHQQRQAQFQILIDDEMFIYCNKCAAHLASQGFQVQKLKSIIQYNKNQKIISNNRISQENKRKQQLHSFIESLNKLSGNYQKKYDQLRKTNISYQVQKQSITNFYSSIVEYIEYIKQQHLGMMEQECIKNVQISEIECGQIEETLEELGQMEEDIKGNLNKIIQEVEQNSYEECMTFYIQKTNRYEHRLEELEEQIKPIVHISDDIIDSKLTEFKIFIDKLIGMENNYSNQKITNMGINVIDSINLKQVNESN